MESNENRVLRFLHKHFPLEVILYIRLFFGHYYSFRCRKLLLIFEKLYCISWSLLIPLYMVISNSPMLNSRITVVIEYVVGIWISVFVEDSCFAEYYSAIKRTDQDFGFRDIPVVTSRIYAAFFLIVTFRILNHLSKMLLYNPYQIIFYIFTLLYTTADFSNLIRIFTFDILYERMMFLRKYFEGVFREPSEGVRGQVKVSEVKRGVMIYKSLLDNLELMDKIQTTFTIALAIRFLCSIAYLHSIFTSVGMIWGSPMRTGLRAAEEICTALLLCAPAVFEELTHNEAEKIEAILMLELTECTDSDTAASLSQAVSYLRLRPFQFRLWRALPADSSLLVFLGSLIFTVGLVLLQMYHFV